MPDLFQYIDFTMYHVLFAHTFAAINDLYGKRFASFPIYRLLHLRKRTTTQLKKLDVLLRQSKDIFYLRSQNFENIIGLL